MKPIAEGDWWDQVCYNDEPAVGEGLEGWAVWGVGGSSRAARGKSSSTVPPSGKQILQRPEPASTCLPVWTLLHLSSSQVLFQCLASLIIVLYLCVCVCVLCEFLVNPSPSLLRLNLPHWSQFPIWCLNQLWASFMSALTKFLEISTTLREVTAVSDHKCSEWVSGWQKISLGVWGWRHKSKRGKHRAWVLSHRQDSCRR